MMWRFLPDVQPPKSKVKNAAEKKEANKKQDADTFVPGNEALLNRRERAESGQNFPKRKKRCHHFVLELKLIKT